MNGRANWKDKVTLKHLETGFIALKPCETCILAKILRVISRGGTSKV